MSHRTPSDDPEISVVIPVYDQPELLVEALDSVRDQTFGPLEAVVVDDASETDFEPIVDEYGDWVRLLVHEENRGAAAARNTGIEATDGEFVAFLDADDVWRPRKLERQRAVFEERGEDVGLVYTGFVQYDTDGSELVQRPDARGEIHLAELERDRVHPTSTVTVRRACLERGGGFDPSLPSRQDYDLWIRLTERYRVDFVDEVLVEKREQPGGISKDFDRRIRGDLAVFEKVRERTADLDLPTRLRIHSFHHHVIGRDYDSNGDRRKALAHLGLAIAQYPFRPRSWAMFAIALFGVDRNGRLLGTLKRLAR